MKTIVLYKSKYGATASIAQRLSQEVSCDVQELTSNTSIKDYDQIVLGSSVYVGMFDKELKTFVNTHMEELRTKKVYMYVSCLKKEEVEKVIRENLGEEFLSLLQRVISIGGVLDFSKMSFMHRQIIKMVNSKDNIVERVDKVSVANMLDEEQYICLKNLLKQHA